MSKGSQIVTDLCMHVRCHEPGSSCVCVCRRIQPSAQQVRKFVIRCAYVGVGHNPNIIPILGVLVQRPSIESQPLVRITGKVLRCEAEHVGSLGYVGQGVLGVKKHSRQEITISHIVNPERV